MSITKSCSATGKCDEPWIPQDRKLKSDFNFRTLRAEIETSLKNVTKENISDVKSKLAKARVEVFDRVSINHERWIDWMTKKGVLKDRSDEGFSRGWLVDSKVV